MCIMRNLQLTLSSPNIPICGELLSHTVPCCRSRLNIRHLYRKATRFVRERNPQRSRVPVYHRQPPPTTANHRKPPRTSGGGGHGEQSTFSLETNFVDLEPAEFSFIPTAYSVYSDAIPRVRQRRFSPTENGHSLRSALPFRPVVNFQDDAQARSTSRQCVYTCADSRPLRSGARVKNVFCLEHPATRTRRLPTHTHVPVGYALTRVGRSIRLINSLICPPFRTLVCTERALARIIV